MSKPMDDAQTDARTVTLSDGSVWTLEVSRVSGRWWHRIGDVLQLRLPQLTGRLPLTAADHRKIADVLDPPAALASPRATPEKPLLDAINKACAIIELGDQRLLASDGPAGGQPPDLTLKEWRTLYVTLDNARKGK